MPQLLPTKWDLQLRLQLIEVISQWEGRFTTNHLCDAFGITRQQATKDIKYYREELAPNNLYYNKQLKGYQPSEHFTPVLTQGIAEEYLQLLRPPNGQTPYWVPLELPSNHSQILAMPLRAVEPAVVRALVQAARRQLRLEVTYLSLNDKADNHDGSLDERVIVPHTLVCSAQRWHVRAYCESSQSYRDFALSRFRGVPEVVGAQEDPLPEDTLWLLPLELIIRPDRRLSARQQAIIAHDYQMVANQLCISTRAALLSYQLHSLGLNRNQQQDNPLAQQIEIANWDEISRYLSF